MQIKHPSRLFRVAASTSILGAVVAALIQLTGVASAAPTVERTVSTSTACQPGDLITVMISPSDVGPLRNLEHTGVLQPEHAVVNPVQVFHLPNSRITFTKDLE